MIYVLAYYRLNLGDDLFIKSLIERYPNEKFYLCTYRKYLKPFIGYKNVSFPNSIELLLLRVKDKLFPNKWGVRNGIVETFSKATVIIGGSIFIDSGNLKRNKVHNNTFIIGANYGPEKTKGFRDSVKRELNQTVSCCFRDSYSYNVFSELDNVRWAPDVIFSYDGLPPTKVGNGIAISVMDLNGHHMSEKQNAYESFIKQICKCFIENGKPVKLLSYCIEEGDSKVAKKILDEMDNNCLIQLVEYNGDIDYVLNAMNDCEFIFASRFHAMILGWKMRKKVLPIVYSNKHLNVLNDVSFNGFYINLLDDSPFSEIEVSSLFDKITINESVDVLAEDALKQFYDLDEFLKEI